MYFFFSVFSSLRFVGRFAGDRRVRTVNERIQNFITVHPDRVYYLRLGSFYDRTVGPWGTTMIRALFEEGL